MSPKTKTRFVPTKNFKELLFAGMNFYNKTAQRMKKIFQQIVKSRDDTLQFYILFKVKTTLIQH